MPVPKGRCLPVRYNNQAPKRTEPSHIIPWWSRRYCDPEKSCS
jgi:hypothetical protein